MTLGGVLNGTANPVSGAPGAVIRYALLAVLLWPADRAGPAGDAEAAPFTAARAVGARAARVLWLVLWLSLAWFALQAANRAPLALHDLLASQAGGATDPNSWPLLALLALACWPAKPAPGSGERAASG